MRAALLSCLFLLAACAASDGDGRSREDRDPVAAAALNEPLMADPDLTNQNQGGAALTGGGPANAEIPPDKRSKDEIDTAREAAVLLAGGTIPEAPPAIETTANSPLDKAVTAPAIVAAMKVGSAACAAQLDYTALWAARLSAPFEVYPRGHVGQSAGTDAAGCRLRVVGFVTPVPAADVIAFYAARARSAGYAVRRNTAGSDDILQGAKGRSTYAVTARQRDDKMTEATLVTSGI